MTIEAVKAWLLKKPLRGTHLHRVPMRHLWVLLVAVFLLFSIVGFHIDLMNGGTVPYIILIAIAIVSGLNSVLWVIVLARVPRIFLVALILLQFFIGKIDLWVANALTALFHPADVPAETGIHFASTCILFLVIISYIFFTRYMGISGKETFRLKNELDLAHSIQKTLVPPIHRVVPSFEIYGVSYPSEKVGGDLVDVVELADGDTVAYLADIAGHGLQAGILMGMLKTAARTALTDGARNGGDAVLSQLMQRLNVVLPQVKEAHMYATFTALRLNRDGAAFYGMAASPPLLHWSAARRQMRSVEEEQFPLGLLPVADFPAHSFGMDVGDLVLIATDGILEVRGEVKTKHRLGLHGAAEVLSPEFGVEAMGRLLEANSAMALPELAAVILDAARAYGKQFDDQTLLLVRRTAA
jgi:serine phosphatase RsbU (regulator of sigma subunit)